MGNAGRAPAMSPGTYGDTLAASHSAAFLSQPRGPLPEPGAEPRDHRAATADPWTRGTPCGRADQGASAADPSPQGPLRCRQHVLLLTLSSCHKTLESPWPGMQKARSSVGPRGPTDRQARSRAFPPPRYAVGERSHSMLLRCLPPRVTSSAPHLSPRWGPLTFQWRRGRRPSEELLLGLGRGPAHPLKGEGSSIPAERRPVPSPPAASGWLGGRPCRGSREALAGQRRPGGKFS